VVGDGCNIAGTMQDADNDDCIGKRAIIDGVGAMEGDAQAWRKLLTGRRRQRKMPDRLKGGFNRMDKTGGNFLGGLARYIHPDFGKVDFGCIGEAEC